MAVSTLEHQLPRCLPAPEAVSTVCQGSGGVKTAGEHRGGGAEAVGTAGWARGALEEA